MSALCLLRWMEVQCGHLLITWWRLIALYVTLYVCVRDDLKTVKCSSVSLYACAVQSFVQTACFWTSEIYLSASLRFFSCECLQLKNVFSLSSYLKKSDMLVLTKKHLTSPPVKLLNYILENNLKHRFMDFRKIQPITSSHFLFFLISIFNFTFNLFLQH